MAREVDAGGTDDEILDERLLSRGEFAARARGIDLLIVLGVDDEVATFA
jgi:hypothetical protein